MNHRVLLAVWVFVVSAFAVHADDKYPSHTVTVIVPQAAGGANDAIARVIAQKLSAVMNRQFLVDNRPGAGGNIAASLAAKARPDGYTLFLTANSMLVINPALYRSPGFDPMKDFEPIALVATAGYLVAANPNFPANSIKELIASAKASPGKIMYGSAGNGTMNHLIGEMLGKAAGIDLVHVPYKAAATAASDVVGGQIPLAVLSVPVSLGLVQSGKLKVLGVSKATRMPLLGQVPTIAEQGVKGFESGTWQGLLVPASTPPAVLARLTAEITRIIRSPDVRAKLVGQGAEVHTMSPTEFSAFFERERKTWAAVVAQGGVKVD